MKGLVFKTPEDGFYFFGYYDKSPLDRNNKNLLAQRAAFMDRMPTETDMIEIGYFDWQHNCEFIKLTETKVWNWQQGCMLQWVGPDFESKIIYNDRVENKFISILMGIGTKQKRVLPIAVYSVSSNGKFAVCIDFERHYWFRNGYAYQGIANPRKNKPLDENDGIWLLNLEKGEVRQIINIMDLVKIKPISTMKGAIHYIEHLVFNPSGKRFCFLHRWRMEDGGVYSRLYTADLNGENIFLLNDSGRMSHFAWRNEDEILAFGGLQNPINSVRRHKYLVRYVARPLMPLYRKLSRGADSAYRNNILSKAVTGDSYILFRDRTDGKKRVSHVMLDKDGHPSFSPKNRDWFVTDTYPQKSQKYVQYTILSNIEMGKVIIVDKLLSRKELFEMPHRCDLHPRWSYDGRYVAIDTTNEGGRSIYLYDTISLINE